MLILTVGDSGVTAAGHKSVALYADFRVVGGRLVWIVAPASLIDRDGGGVMDHSLIEKWRDDRHHFRIILAPADDHRLNMTAYTRKFMAEMESLGLGLRLLF